MTTGPADPARSSATTLIWSKGWTSTFPSSFDVPTGMLTAPGAVRNASFVAMLDSFAELCTGGRPCCGSLVTIALGTSAGNCLGQLPLRLAEAVSTRGRSGQRTGSLCSHQDPACNEMVWPGT